MLLFIFEFERSHPLPNGSADRPRFIPKNWRVFCVVVPSPTGSQRDKTQLPITKMNLTLNLEIGSLFVAMVLLWASQITCLGLGFFCNKFLWEAHGAPWIWGALGRSPSTEEIHMSRRTRAAEIFHFPADFPKTFKGRFEKTLNRWRKQLKT